MVLDLLVVGAGPAGVAAAITGRALGLDTLLVDKATFPRDKICGDGLTAHALRLLEHLGVDVPSAAGFEPVRETVVRSTSGRQVVLPLPADGLHAAVVPRIELDRALVERARAAGVECREGTRIVSLTCTDDTPADKRDDDRGRSGVRHVHAGFDDGGSVRARYLVAADGHWSAVRRLRDPDACTDFGPWHAFRQYFRGVEERRQWVLFEEDILPGYAWVFPLPGGRANVGFGVRRTADTTGKALAALWRDLLTRPSLRSVLGPNAEPDGRMNAWPIPSSFDATRLTDGRVLYAGDAARVVDPMTGEGIAQALETGMLAAEAVARGGDVASQYRRAVERSIGRDLRFAATLQRMILSPRQGQSPRRARAGLRLADLNGVTRRNFARWMFEDYPRAAVLTPDRWRRGLLKPEGAYAHRSS